MDVVQVLAQLHHVVPQFLALGLHRSQRPQIAVHLTSHSQLRSTLRPSIILRCVPAPFAPTRTTRQVHIGSSVLDLAKRVFPLLIHGFSALSSHRARGKLGSACLDDDEHDVNITIGTCLVVGSASLEMSPFSGLVLLQMGCGTVAHAFL